MNPTEHEYPRYASLKADSEAIRAYYSVPGVRSIIGWALYHRVVEVVEAWQFVLDWMIKANIPERVLVDPRYGTSWAGRGPGDLEIELLAGKLTLLASATNMPSADPVSAEDARPEVVRSNIERVQDDLLVLVSRLEASRLLSVDANANTFGASDEFWNRAPAIEQSFDDLTSRVAREVSDSENEAAAHRAMTAADAADAAAETAAQRIAELAAVVLAENQSEYARQQQNLAWTLRGATVVLVVVAAVIGFCLTSSEEAPSTATTIHQLAIVAVILGLAGYVGKQASQHMSVSIWAQTLQVQLKTFDPFLANVKSDVTRDEIRKQFALRAFSSAPDLTGDSGDVSWIPQVLAAIAERK